MGVYGPFVLAVSDLGTALILLTRYESLRGTKEAEIAETELSAMVRPGVYDDAHGRHFHVYGLVFPGKGIPFIRYRCANHDTDQQMPLTSNGGWFWPVGRSRGYRYMFRRAFDPGEYHE